MNEYRKMLIARGKKLLEIIESFEYAFDPLGSPNSTLELEAHLKEKGRTTNLSI
jgi:hypothetical protein